MLTMFLTRHKQDGNNQTRDSIHVEATDHRRQLGKTRFERGLGDEGHRSSTVECSHEVQSPARCAAPHLNAPVISVLCWTISCCMLHRGKAESQEPVTMPTREQVAGASCTCVKPSGAHLGLSYHIVASTAIRRLLTGNKTAFHIEVCIPASNLGHYKFSI